MAASVTYDGVESAEGGTIFKDVKFWVAMRVPARKTILDHITNNGGTPVTLERNADVRIADHARKDAPPGSCSWKLIEDSVKYGALQLPDRYQIGPDPNIPRPAASGGLTKNTRTPFSHADDAALAKWVLSKPNKREGNAIFQDFALLNPRHTWQSWRHRWAKKLKLLPQDQLKMLALTAQAHPPPSQEVAQENAQSRALVEDDQGSNETPRAEDSPSGHESEPDNESVQERVEIVAPAPRDEETERQRDQAPEDSESGHETSEIGDQFYRDLNSYARLEGLDLDLTPRIRGKPVDLWQLAQAVNSQEAPTDRVDWLKVANDLNYQGRDVQSIAGAMRQCFEEILEGFLISMEEFADAKDSSSDEESDGDIAAKMPALEGPPEPVIPSSPPMGSSRSKRPREMQLLSSPGPSKRRRVSSNAEIPSTPDEKLGVIRDNPNNRYHSPGNRRNLRAYDLVQDSQGSQQLPVLPQAVERRLEPETQDYGFDQAPQPPANLQTQLSSFDVTPSQQLHTELLDATPIPLRLDRGRKDCDTSSSGEPTPGPKQRSKPPTTTEPSASRARPVSRPATAEPPKVAKAPRRSLPISFASQPPQEVTTAFSKLSTPGPAATSSKPTPQQPKPSNGATVPGNIQKDNRGQISWWIEHYESLGYSHAIVVKAMKCTTMTTGGTAALVMQSLRDGKGIPTHCEGAWTDRDDDGLRLIDSVDANMKVTTAQEAQHLKKAKRESDRLIKKHTLDRVELRRKFLEAEAARRKEAAQG